MRDMVAAEIALADHLGMDRWRLITGPSMGGMRAIEWAVTVPDRVGAIAPVGSAAATTADQIAWSTSQVGGHRRRTPRFAAGTITTRPTATDPTLASASLA